ncbi:unnamed protein product [Penicillium pancosmium]
MASLGDQLFFTDVQTQSDDWVDFEQFLDLPVAYGDDYSASATVSPDMSLPYDAETLGNDLPDFSQSAFPDMINYGTSDDQFLADQSPVFGMMPDTPIFDDEMFNAYQPYDNGVSFRQMVETQAAADPRATSIKEKRREAAIELHLQRLCDATARDLDMSSDSNTSFSSPSWSDCMRGSISPQPGSFESPANTPVSASASSAGTGSLEMVLDLNMNATTNLPKKQKPRSQAQKENYIKARKYGACEKHKKQHKRCNCLEKAAARAGVSDVPLTTNVKERPRQPMLHAPVLPDTRQSGVPGHDPSLAPRLAAKMIKRSISSSPEHDPSRGLCAVLPTVRTPKRSNVPGHDQNPCGVLPAVRATKQSDVAAPDRLRNTFTWSTVRTSKQSDVLGQDRNTSGILPTVRATRQSNVPGHDRQNNAFVVSPTVKATKHGDIAGQDRQYTTSVLLPIGKRRSSVPGQNSQDSSSGVLHVNQTAGKCNRALGHANSCRPPSALQSAKASREPAARSRTLGPANVLSKDRNNRNVSPTTSSGTGNSLKAILQVRPPNTGMPSRLTETSEPGRTRIHSDQKQYSQGLCNPNTLAISRPSHKPTPQGVNQPLESISTVPNHGPKQSLAQRSSRSLSLTHGIASQAIPTGQIVRSITSQLGGLFSSVVSTISGALFSAVSPAFASRSEQLMFNCLSFCGAHMMSAKKGLQLYQL